MDHHHNNHTHTLQDHHSSHSSILIRLGHHNNHTHTLQDHHSSHSSILTRPDHHNSHTHSLVDHHHCLDNNHIPTRLDHHHHQDNNNILTLLDHHHSQDNSNILILLDHPHNHSNSINTRLVHPHHPKDLSTIQTSRSGGPRPRLLQHRHSRAHLQLSPPDLGLGQGHLATPIRGHPINLRGSGYPLKPCLKLTHRIPIKYPGLTS